ncbi:MAG: response regulator [Bacteroidetes bacterium]|nr:response regulator [Bacteroidota bacterium]
MKKEIKILMIDDDNEDFFIMKDLLKNKEDRKYTIDWVTNYEEGLQIVLKDRHDVYIIDYSLGAYTGIDLINNVTEIGCDKPLIILTGQNDPFVENKAMDAGATDYLIKSEITARSIETTIRYSIANARHKKEMQKLNEELENKVIQRTQSLENILSELQLSRTELQAAVKKEIKLNEMKSNFISTVSHEFRTPLTSILSSLYLVSQYCQKNDIENHTKHINRITGSVNYLTDLLNDMLSINILEEKKQSLHPEICNVNSFMNELQLDIKPFIKKNKILYLIILVKLKCFKTKRS